MYIQDVDVLLSSLFSDHNWFGCLPWQYGHLRRHQITTATGTFGEVMLSPFEPDSDLGNSCDFEMRFSYGTDEIGSRYLIKACCCSK